jgi:hypothetical protein
MRSSITISYLEANVPIRASHEICVINAHPPGVSWGDILTTATNVIGALEGDYSGLLTEVEQDLGDAFKGKNALYKASDHLSFLSKGSYLINGERIHPDEIGIVFRATSEDKITKSFGRADQPSGILGRQIEDRSESLQEHQYTRAFSIPLKRITPGEYLFTFASGDDGLIFDVGVSTILAVTIVPRSG